MVRHLTRYGGDCIEMPSDNSCFKNGVIFCGQAESACGRNGFSIPGVFVATLDGSGTISDVNVDSTIYRLFVNAQGETIFLSGAFYNRLAFTQYKSTVPLEAENAGFIAAIQGDTVAWVRQLTPLAGNGNAIPLKTMIDNAGFLYVGVRSAGGFAFGSTVLKNSGLIKLNGSGELHQFYQYREKDCDVVSADIMPDEGVAGLALNGQKLLIDRFDCHLESRARQELSFPRKFGVREGRVSAVSPEMLAVHGTTSDTLMFGEDRTLTLTGTKYYEPQCYLAMLSVENTTLSRRLGPEYDLLVSYRISEDTVRVSCFMPEEGNATLVCENGSGVELFRRSVDVKQGFRSAIPAVVRKGERYLLRLTADGRYLDKRLVIE